MVQAEQIRYQRPPQQQQSNGTGWHRAKQVGLGMVLRCIFFTSSMQDARSDIDPNSSTNPQHHISDIRKSSKLLMTRCHQRLKPLAKRYDTLPPHRSVDPDLLSSHRSALPQTVSCLVTMDPDVSVSYPLLLLCTLAAAAVVIFSVRAALPVLQLNHDVREYRERPRPRRGHPVAWRYVNRGRRR